MGWIYTLLASGGELLMVWTALGILGTAVIGAVVLKETLDTLELHSLLLILIAVVSLRISSVKTSG
jgi:multidrug transporter EmrE-like cation transporter